MCIDSVLFPVPIFAQFNTISFLKTRYACHGISYAKKLSGIIYNAKIQGTWYIKNS